MGVRCQGDRGGHRDCKDVGCRGTDCGEDGLESLGVGLEKTLTVKNLSSSSRLVILLVLSSPPQINSRFRTTRAANPRGGFS